MKHLLNLSSLILGHTFRLLSGVLVGLLVARHLGPADFGTMSAVLAAVGLLGPLVNLGLPPIVQREFVIRDQASWKLVSTVFWARCYVAVAVALIAIPLTGLFYGSEKAWLLASIAAVGYLFLPVDTFDYWLRSQVRNHISVVTQVGGRLISDIFRLSGIMVGAGVVWFVAAFPLEMLSIAIIFALAHRVFSLPNIRFFFDFQLFKSLLRESWPLMISGLGAAVFFQIDQIMLYRMVGAEQTGVYAAAARISSVANFIPLAVIWTIQSHMVKANQRSGGSYWAPLSQVATLMALASYIMVATVYFTKDWLIAVAYGDGYEGAAAVLFIHIIGVIFLYQAVVRGIWTVIEKKPLFMLYSNLLGALANVLLNLVMIPHYGVLGAAWASSISYCVFAILAGMPFPVSRKVWQTQLIALSLVRLPVAMRLLKQLKFA